jgi:hypothetical protein
MRPDGPHHKQAQVHRVVCWLTYGYQPTRDSDGKMIDACHRRSNGKSCPRRDCINPRHLRWDSRKGNFADKVADGTFWRTITAETILAVYAKKGTGLREIDVAEEFDTSQQHVNRIWTGATGSAITGQVYEPSGRRRLTTEGREAIMTAPSSESDLMVSRRLGINRKTVWRVRREGRAAR